MEKKKDKSYLVIVILLLIIVLTSFSLYRSLNAGASGNDNAVVGTLTFKNKNIERKYDSDVVWETIESGLLIRNKDTIRSGEYSDAVLTLEDKTKININENSMIYVDVSENNINLNFAYGSMSLSKKSNGSSEVTLKIKSGDNTVEVKDSDLSLEKKGKEELSFQVNKGSAKLTNGDQEKEIKENESANLNGSDISISETALNLVNPADGSIISERSESIPVNFSWTAKNTNNLKLEIAFDSRFKSIHKIYSVGNESYTASLGQGNYYWRLSNETSKNKKVSSREYSPFRKLTVYSVSPPSLISPKQNQIFAFSGVTPIILFNWKRLSTAKNYKLEISKNSGFTEIIKTVTSSQTSIHVDKLAAGKYFARLIAEPIRDDFKEEKSDSISFSLEKKTELDSPILISPGIGQELSSILFSKSGFLFQVKDSPELSSYTFQISSDANFAKILQEKTSQANQTKLLSNLELGEYYWRVKGNTTDGRQTPYSKFGNFFIKENQSLELLSPKNNSSVDIKESPIYFRWNRQSIKTNFLLEISTTADFKEKIHSIKTEEYFTSQTISKDGTYFWRVLSVGENETVFSKSSVYSFKLEEGSQLIPIFPLANTKVDMSPLDSLPFRWEENPKAKSYVFELFREKSGVKSLIVKSNTKQNAFIFRDLPKLDEGNFIWTLEKGSDEETQSHSRKKMIVPFKIYLSDKLDTPKIKTPKKMYVE